MARRTGGKNNSSKHFVFAENFMVLPHENGDEFDLLHQRLIEEWKPVGALEEDTVLTLANCIWLKRRVEHFYNREATWGQFHQYADDIILVLHIAKLLDTATTLKDAMPLIARLPELYRKSTEEVLQSDSFQDDKKRIQSVKSHILTLAEGQESFTIETQSLTFKAEKVAQLRELTAKKINLDERLDARIDKALKRLAQLKTFKRLLEDQTSRAKAIDHRGASKQLTC
jgi:hypothetical protein